MARDVREYAVLKDVAPRAIVSSTNASPIVVTATGHPYETGDKVTIIGHLVNTAANGSWTVTKTGPNTFSLDGSTGSGVGGATGTHALRSKFVFCEDFDSAVISIDTDGGGDAAMTVKLVGSIQSNPPDFGLPQSKSNQYEFIQMIDLESSAEINGDVGVTVATADIHRMFEANINGLRWLSLLITAGTQGEVSSIVRVFGDTR